MTFTSYQGKGRGWALEHFPCFLETLTFDALVHTVMTGKTGRGANDSCTQNFSTRREGGTAPPLPSKKLVKKTSEKGGNNHNDSVIFSRFWKVHLQESIVRSAKSKCNFTFLKKFNNNSSFKKSPEILKGHSSTWIKCVSFIEFW